MAYVEIPDADIDVGSYGKENLVFQRLRDNLRALRHALFSVLFAEVSTTSTTFVTAATFELYVPDFPDESGYQRALTLHIQAKVSGGPTGSYHLKDSASGNTGSDVTTTSTTYVELAPSLNIASAWKGTVRTILLEYKQNASGTAFARSIDRIAGELAY